MSSPISQPIVSSSQRLARRQVERVFAEVERRTSLLDRCRPLDLPRQLAALKEAWAAGRRQTPRWQYAPPPDLGDLAELLARLAAELDRSAGYGALYAARARELELDARVANAIGRPEFRQLAAARFQAGNDQAAQQASTWARAWAGSATLAHPSPRDQSLALGDLFTAMQRGVGARRLPLRVEQRENLLSAAALGQGVVYVAARKRWQQAEVARIVLHELEGHAVPRARSAAEPCGLFAVGFAGGCADEEGRALYLERQAGLMGPARRAELAWRHLAAEAVIAGADWMETVEVLLEWSVPTDLALEVATRCLRGGGLAREIIYLPALARFEQAVAQGLAPESWLSRGRASIRSIPQLQRLSSLPASF